jgi:hypothetical protein
VVQAPWGVRRLTKIDDQSYKADSVIKAGEIGRAGRLIGRIQSVTDKQYVIDWGRPFGARPLICQVVVHPAPTHKS